MSKLLKQLVVDELKREIADVDSALILQYTGVSSEDNSELRADLRKNQVRMRIIKNSLAKVSFQGGPLEPLSEAFDGPTALAYTLDGDPVAVPKTLTSWEKKLEGVKFTGGVLEGRALTREDILRLADLPSRNELIGQILGCLQSPLAGIARCLVSPLQGIIGCLEALHDKKKEAGEE